MPSVVDASLAMARVVADEHTSDAETLLRRVKVGGARVPDLFWHEVRDVLLKIERRGRSPRGAAEVALMTLRRLPIAMLTNRSDDVILDIARTDRLTPFAACCLDLAIGLQFPRATSDRALAFAAQSAGIPILGS